eukprot:7396293-Alexandrium_andersonii.AAC.1
MPRGRQYQWLRCNTTGAGKPWARLCLHVCACARSQLKPTGVRLRLQLCFGQLLLRLAPPRGNSYVSCMESFLLGQQLWARGRALKQFPDAAAAAAVMAAAIGDGSGSHGIG